MPTYQYACTTADCGNRFELVQSFTDPSASECPVCGGPVRKVYGAVGVVFKGSGFYRNDSRESGRAGSGAAASGSAKSESSESASSSSASSASDSSSKSSSSSDSSSGSGSSSSSSSSGSSGSSSGSSSSA